MIDELDYLRGRCTGLPECCIDFFVALWLDVCRNRSNATVRAFYDMHQKAMQPHFSQMGTGYVPCPKCLEAHTFVRARRCKPATCFCGEAVRRRKRG